MGAIDVIVLGGLGGNPGDVSDELCKAKSALLYGDRVLVRSHKVHLLTAVTAANSRLLSQRAKEEGVDQQMIDRAIANLEAMEETPNRRLMLETLRSDHPEVFFEIPELAARKLREFDAIPGEFFFRKIAVGAVQAYFPPSEPDNSEQSVKAMEDLIHLNESGLVKIDTLSAEELLRLEHENVLEAFQRSIEGAVEELSVSSMDHPLLTPGANLKIRNIGEEKNSKPDLTKLNRAELAANMLADIPSLPTASVDEILDIRERVSDQLGRFRAAVADLEEELNADVGSEDFPAAVADLKLRRVDPELEELRESLLDEGLGQTASRSAPYLATGVLGLGASVAIGAPELASAMAASAGATTAVAKEIVERAKLDRARKKHRLFLLFDVERRLARRKQP